MNHFWIILLLFFSVTTFWACSKSIHPIKDKSAYEFSLLVNSNPNVVILDVRTPSEFQEGHLAKAVNINMQDDNFVQQVEDKYDTSQKIAVYCRSGKRSMNAAKQLSTKGYRIYNLKGGIVEWNNKGMRTIK